MNSYLFIALFVLLGIGLAFVFNLLVVRNFPEEKRKSGKVKTYVVFIITALALSGLMQFKLHTVTVLDEKSQELNEFVNENFPGVDFVKNGVNFTEVKDNINSVNNIISDLQKIIPSHTELGVSKGLYDFLSGPLFKKLQQELINTDLTDKVGNTYTDENNYLTVPSIINGLKNNVTKIINIVLWVIASIFILIFVVHIIKCIKTALKDEKE